MNTRRVVATVVALGIALAPAAASASTTPTTYTKAYAGYYATTHVGPRGDVNLQVTLPALTSLASITNGVTSEIRLYSSRGQLDLQIGADPQTSTMYVTKWEQSGFGAAMQAEVNFCNQTYPGYITPGSTVSEDVYLNAPGYNDGNTIVDWGVNPGNGCELDFSSLVKFTKVAVVSSFNAKGFHTPSSPATLASYSNIDIPSMAASMPGTFTSYAHGQYIATSTGTKTGVVRAKPSVLSGGGGTSYVSIP